MSIPYDLPLKDLLTFFLFVDFIVMVIVGVILFKTRHKKGKTEQLLEEIRDLFKQNPYGCVEKASEHKKSMPTPEPVEELSREGENAKKLATAPSTDVEVSHYEVEAEDGLSELNLIKNALGVGSRPLTKMPGAVENLLKKTRERKGPIETPGMLMLPPPPPPRPTPGEEEKITLKSKGE
jgi:hypothetical protein